MALIDSFWKHLDRSGGPESCWPWMRSRLSLRQRRPGGQIEGNYGCVRVNGTTLRAHRVAWELANGRSIPDGLVVRHACDNAPCCNPSHLVLGTLSDNRRDRIQRGRDILPLRSPLQRGVLIGQAKLDDDEVREMRDAYRAGDTIPVLAARYGLGTSTTRSALIGRTWSHVPDPVTEMRSASESKRLRRSAA